MDKRIIIGITLFITGSLFVIFKYDIYGFFVSGFGLGILLRGLK